MGRFLALETDNHLILQITQKLAAGQPLNAMKIEELKIVKMACSAVLSRGLELMLVRETLHNVGTADNIILNRRICPRFWARLYAHLQRHVRDFPYGRLFHEAAAAELSRALAASPCLRDLARRFVAEETGLVTRVPDDVLRDGNFLFSLGTVYSHRFFRLARFVHRCWGTDEHEPAVRLACQRLWLFFLLLTGKLSVSREAFARQRTNHELGVFGFLLDDYRTFTGTVGAPESRISGAEASALIRELLNTGNISILC